MEKPELTENWENIIPNMVGLARRGDYRNGVMVRGAGRIPEFEPYIILSSKDAANYAASVIKGTWPEAENIISTSDEASINYAVNVIRGKWERGEDSISKSPKISFQYAKFLKSPFPQGEDAISINANLSFQYAELIRSSFIKGEPEIARHDLEREAEGKSKYSLSANYYYHVIQTEGVSSWTEERLKLSPCWMYLYAKEQVNGRLSDTLHHTMMALGIRYKNDYYIKKYLGAKKYTKKIKKRVRKTVDVAAEILEKFGVGNCNNE